MSNDIPLFHIDVIAYPWSNPDAVPVLSLLTINFVLLWREYQIQPCRWEDIIQPDPNPKPHTYSHQMLLTFTTQVRNTRCCPILLCHPWFPVWYVAVFHNRYTSLSSKYVSDGTYQHVCGPSVCQYTCWPNGYKGLIDKTTILGQIDDHSMYGPAIIKISTL